MKMKQKHFNKINIEMDDYVDILIAASRRAFNSDNDQAKSVADYVNKNLDNLNTRFYIVIARDIVEINTLFDHNFDKSIWEPLVLNPILDKLKLLGYTYNIVKHDYDDGYTFDCYHYGNIKQSYKDQISIDINPITELVLYHAINYAIGRDTFMPGTVTSSIISYIPLFSDDFLSKCIKLLDTYEYLGYDDIVATWSRFYGEIAKEQMMRRINKKYIGAHNRIFAQTS